MASIILVAIYIDIAVNHFEGLLLDIFFLCGFASWMNQAGTNTLNLEICPADRIPTNILLLSTLTSPSVFVAAAIGTFGRELTGQLVRAAVLSAIRVKISYSDGRGYNRRLPGLRIRNVETP